MASAAHGYQFKEMLMLKIRQDPPSKETLWASNPLIAKLARSKMQMPFAA